MRAHLRNNGRLVFQNATGEEAFALQLAAHLEGWKWQDQSGGEPIDAEHQTVCAELPGIGSKNRIVVTSRVWQEADGSVVFEVDAQSGPTTEERVCSLCVHLFLPASRFEGATVTGALALSLADPGSAPRDDCNPFASSSAACNRYNEMKAFSVASKDKRIAFDVSLLDGGQQGVLFTDVRKWGPQFDVRIGDSPKSPFSFSTGKWRV